MAALTDWIEAPQNPRAQRLLLDNLVGIMKESYFEDFIEKDRRPDDHDEDILIAKGRLHLNSVLNGIEEQKDSTDYLTLYKSALCKSKIGLKLDLSDLGPLITQLDSIAEQLNKLYEAAHLAAPSQDDVSVLLRSPTGGASAAELKFRKESVEQFRSILSFLADPIGAIQKDPALHHLKDFAIEYCKFQIEAQELREYALTMPDGQKKTDALELADIQIAYSRHALLGMLHDVYEEDESKHIGRARLDTMNTKCGAAFNSKLASLEKHRDPKIKRIAGNILMGLATLVTAGLAAIAKVSHSKLSTGLYTLFSSRPNSARHADRADEQRHAFYRMGAGLTAGAA